MEYFTEGSGPMWLQYSQLVQELRPVNHCKCRDCNEWVEKKIALYPAFKSKILFSDEAQFWLSGFVI